MSAGDQGLRDALRDTRITIVDVGLGDTGLAAQARLLNGSLDRDIKIEFERHVQGYAFGEARVLLEGGAIGPGAAR